MIQKRNGFLTMVLALIPGAGHMYNGFMKRGLSLLSMFAVVWAVTYLLDLDVLFALNMVIWFYAFFDCLNRRFQTDELFYAQEDCYLITSEMITSLKTFGGGKARVALGGTLLALGIYAIWNNLIMSLIGFMLPDGMSYYLRHISRSIPQILIAGLIIWLSIVMIREKSNEVKKEQEEREE